MDGCEPESSGVRSNCSANCAITITILKPSKEELTRQIDFYCFKLFFIIHVIFICVIELNALQTRVAAASTYLGMLLLLKKLFQPLSEHSH